MALKYLGEQPGAGAQSPARKAPRTSLRRTTIPPPLLAKILQTLARAGLLVSHAGNQRRLRAAAARCEISASRDPRHDGPLLSPAAITIHGSCDWPALHHQRPLAR